MPNPLLHGTENLNLMQIKQMMNMVNNASNPQAMLNWVVQNNPKYKQVMEYINQNGGDPEQAFYKMANERGINPDEVLNQLK